MTVALGAAGGGTAEEAAGLAAATDFVPEVGAGRTAGAAAAVEAAGFGWPGARAGTPGS
ncbi:MAG TPA: hypothetical protein VHM31_09780 [Polyangia bacterium]|nr:hypothetical protein [Polyangia bacterium]